MSCQEVAEQEGLQIIFIKIENEFEKALVQCATLVAWWLSRKLQLLEGIYILSHHGHAQWEHFLHCCTSLVIIKVVGGCLGWWSWCWECLHGHPGLVQCRWSQIKGGGVWQSKGLATQVTVVVKEFTSRHVPAVHIADDLDYAMVHFQICFPLVVMP